ncbi:MAG TPA: hypothetical protein VNU26_19050 [Mycobacteriales bacterium]|nr:hypothetical protein [Mycobacteriales bacterium]
MPSRDHLAGALRLLRLLAAAGLLAAGLAVLPSSASAAPATPSGMPAEIEVPQPYVGQKVCDPVAKPGVRAFVDMVLRTYPGTSSLGIVRDCGVGGTSEHKEGRAWDWGVNYYDATQRAQANDLLAWLTKPDNRGYSFAMARRLGIMYMIWNKQIWKAYDADKGWQPYSGPSPHTDHVHFSFGWNGAKKVTSFWDGTVAPVDYGPGGAPSSAVVPVPSKENLAVLRAYGDTTLSQGSSGTAVAVMQRGLKISDDGAYGSGTASAVAAFQRSQGVSTPGSFGPRDWLLLFPPPVDPFGSLDAVRVDLQTVHVAGWVIDADTTSPLRVHVYVDGRGFASADANASRPDVAGAYPEFGDDVGFRLNLQLPEGNRQVCVYGINATGSRGVNTLLGCRDVLVLHSPQGAVSVVEQPPGSPATKVTGWAFDPNTHDPATVHVYVNGKAARAGVADQPTSTVSSVSTPRPSAAYDVDVVMPQGRSSVCVWAINASGTPGASKQLGCKDVVVDHMPRAAFDAATVMPGSVRVSGWALDPDSTGAQVVHMYLNGKPVSAIRTGHPRGDVARAYPGLGENLGWVADLTVPAGSHTLCAYALNASGTPGQHVRSGCRTVTVVDSPVGTLDVVRNAPHTTTPGSTTVTGWALDPDTAAPIAVHVYVNGRPTTAVTANGADGRSTGAWPYHGATHGFSADLTLTDGTHRVCAYGINAGGTPGRSALLGCRDVVVRHSPTGQLQAVSAPAPGALRASGWALDPDVAGPVEVHLYLDGKPVRAVKAGLRNPVSLRWWPHHGEDHGFVVDVPASAGTHSLCAYALNAGGTPGGSVRLGCRSVTAS